MTNFLLYESASGYGLFEVEKFDELSNSVDELQKSILDVSRFGKSVKLIAFKPFTSAANALEQINAVSESQVSACTRVTVFRETNLMLFWCRCLFFYSITYHINADNGGSGELFDHKHAQSQEQLKGQVQTWGV